MILLGVVAQRRRPEYAPHRRPECGTQQSKPRAGSDRGLGECATTEAAFNRVWGLADASGADLFPAAITTNYAKKRIPIVFLTTGPHEDYDKVTDEASKIDYVKLGRVARPMHDVVVAVGNRRTRPR
jgi:hypothetical protein